MECNLVKPEDPKKTQKCSKIPKMIKITDLMADLYEGNSDAQKTALWGGPQVWHIWCLTKGKMSILEHFCKGGWAGLGWLGRLNNFEKCWVISIFDMPHLGLRLIYILFYSVLFCFILFYSVLFCWLFCFILFYSVLFCFILFYSVFKPGPEGLNPRVGLKYLNRT